MNTLGVAVMAGMLTLGAVVPIGVLLWIFRRNARPLALEPGPDGVLRLHGQLFQPHQQFDLRVQYAPDRFGEIALTPEELQWTAGGTVWRTPYQSILVDSVHGAGHFAGAAGIDFQVAGRGAWRLVVSDQPINRFMVNDAKRWREGRMARAVADELLRRGARAARPLG